MPKKTWTLTDTSGELHHDLFRITSADMPGMGERWSVSKRTLRGGLRDGVELVEVDNGRMKLSIVPTRGMGIWRAELDNGQVLGWRSPVRGPVHPKFVPLTEPSGLGWLEGFDELVVRCGLESNGAPIFNENGQLVHPLHGRIANRPAHHVEVTVDDSAGTITVRGLVEESRFHFNKLRLVAAITTKLGSTSFSIHDEVENFGGTPTEIRMLYHINVGEPLLSPGAQIVAPVSELAPLSTAVTAANVDTWDQFGPPKAGASEQCFYFDLLAGEDNQTQVLLKNAESSAGTSVRFDKSVLPHLVVWKNMVAPADGYVTGLEPTTCFLNPQPFEVEHGRIVELAAGEKWNADVSVDWLTTADEVTTAEDAVRQLQSTTTPTLHEKPLPHWTA